MKAMTYTQQGSQDLFELRDLPVPSPRDTEVLIRICAASVNPLDWKTMRVPSPLRTITGQLLTKKQKVLGCDLAGRVEAVGKLATQFRPGDDVFGARGFAGGAFAEYACVDESKLVLKPSNISFEAAAAAPVAALTALQGLRDQGHLQAGQEVLIDGASGGVGTFAIQIAKSFEARVTAVCSTRNVDQAKSLGADQVIDYTREDFSQSGQRYDLILGANANRSITDYRRALKPNGIFVLVGGSLGKISQLLLQAPLLSLAGKQKMRFFIAKVTNKDLAVLADMLRAGTITSVIDRRYSLADVGEAFRYCEAGHARGKVVVNVGPGDNT